MNNRSAIGRVFMIMLIFGVRFSEISYIENICERGRSSKTNYTDPYFLNVERKEENALFNNTLNTFY